MTTHLPAALLPLLLALVQGLLLWALWSLRRSFVPRAEHLRCRQDEQQREALWLRRLDLLEQALAQERELLTPLADEVRALREEDRWQQLPGAALLRCRPPREVQ